MQTTVLVNNMQTYCVTMRKNNKEWQCYTQANSKFDAMLQMNKKYGCGATAVDAVVVENHEWRVDV